ncbi:sulfatase-like hydrolase/transferase [Falsirhodobacter sp. alg1]|uniref:sulfatase-like hydrolase/transferase n=1 Tax=Falsirhodobacter sp. alg1 TaxID=1472418 RepID=UPI0005ED6E64|nr:sulfatase-like hydrolase/transferase [Falsirhodobacter sp. alg1]
MTDRPNILILCTDQQRRDTLSCYGAIGAVTPNLDRLAAQGARFENAYVQNPICGPSRASLFTGMYVRNHGLWANGVSLPEDRQMFTRTLADAGYDCGMVGKQHLAACDGWQTEPRRDDGYRVWDWSHGKNHRSVQNAYLKWLHATYPDIYSAAFPEKGANENTHIANMSRTGTPIDAVPPHAHYTHWVATRVVDFVRTPRGDQPFFMMANFFDPHHPFGVPQEYRDRIDAAKIPLPVGFAGELRTKPADQEKYSRTSYGGEAPGFQDYTAEEIREIRAIYYAMITFIDDEVGRILAALDASGQADNTLVIFTSDHGEMLGDHSQLMKGPMMYDAAVRVPLLMRWPLRIATDTVVAPPVQWVDIAPTCLDAAAAGRMAQHQGASLLPLARGGDTAGWRDWAMCEYRDSGIAEDPAIMTTMLRKGDWKLVLWHGDPDTDRPPEGELYNLATDPAELNNLFDSPGHAGTRRRMKRALLDVYHQTEDRSAYRPAVA